jgi:hypothetical protein
MSHVTNSLAVITVEQYSKANTPEIPPKVEKEHETPRSKGAHNSVSRRPHSNIPVMCDIIAPLIESQDHNAYIVYGQSVICDAT